ncbi:MAG: hypothetical protein R3D85_15020 [Paracoccaceae bacterium]
MAEIRLHHHRLRGHLGQSRLCRARLAIARQRPRIERDRPVLGQDRTADTIPFTIEGGAPDNALWIDGFTGYVGFGTTIPLEDLHIVNGYYPGIRLEAQGLGGQLPQGWLIKNVGRFQILDATHSNDAPFSIDPSTDDDLLRLVGSRVAIGGYFAADSSLHIQREDGSASLHVQELSATVSPRTLLHLENSGRPEIVMANTDTGGEWSFGAGTNFILKQGAVGSASNAKTKLFEIDDAGNAT